MYVYNLDMNIHCLNMNIHCLDMNIHRLEINIHCLEMNIHSLDMNIVTVWIWTFKSRLCAIIKTTFTDRLTPSGSGKHV